MSTTPQADIPNPIPDLLFGRLYNWKFDQAVEHLEPDWDGPRASLVRTLAAMYGNCGWFDGLAGDMVRYSLMVLGVVDDD